MSVTESDLSHRLGLTLPSPLMPFTPDWPGAERVNLWIKRDDLIHPVISGNKWRKMSALLAHHAATCQHIVSFGGGYSNHLHALGWCCKQLGIAFTAIIRGHYQANPTPMIADLLHWGAEIRYVTKIEYQQRHSQDYLALLTRDYPQALIIPEGGSQQLALQGIHAMLAECQQPFDTIVTPVASGATMAGMVSGVSEQQQVLGIAVLNGVGYLENLVAQFLPEKSDCRWQILHQFHHGGYARKSADLLSLCEEMQQKYSIAVEPVYSGKVFFAMKELLKQAFFPAGQQIIIVHTGGLQGARNDLQAGL
ncbi:1-aminocyclopropane-1-carboxylate deaminase/D-cysteine desulfhydrase [Alteromonas lipolytica]|uniref:Cysteine desulfhydrase n=1 Tax=Alteromonas lipolytica TaxID=1856405 RepID=A0A1E8FA89_9ALTE|nr:pyridoxal-phosphate dependent enzyme [Alteromonas lipolytica]OFI32830.1 cysteine desulfhydrase [Alteromonas lipolytica]GGF73842.1 1-aminocyclopropane-1-carboxylate deaminase [Alteromonas lipolytica]